MNFGSLFKRKPKFKSDTFYGFHFEKNGTIEQLLQFLQEEVSEITLHNTLLVDRDDGIVVVLRGDNANKFSIKHNDLKKCLKFTFNEGLTFDYIKNSVNNLLRVDD